jgi:starvation-inducible outer membrane lipoprotein
MAYKFLNMRKIFLLILTIFTCTATLLLSSCLSQSYVLTKQTPSTAAPIIKYEQKTLEKSLVHILTIPPDSQYSLTPVISEKLITIEELARDYQLNHQSNNQFIAIINAGFFDPVNQKSTSYITRDEKLVANPKQNERLINNPNLKYYLNQIFNRSEFRRYQCQKEIKYDITLHNQAISSGCKLIDALGAGPQLLPELTLEKEAFVDKSKGRDVLGSQGANARTALGIKDDGTIVLVMVSQKPNMVTSTSGMSLFELADFLKNLGVEKALNLDGGSSSSLHYQGQSFYGKIDTDGKAVRRPVKSFLILGKS